MKLGKLLLYVGQRCDDMSISPISGAGLSGPASPRSSVADVQEHLLDFA